MHRAELKTALGALPLETLDIFNVEDKLDQHLPDLHPFRSLMHHDDRAAVRRYQLGNPPVAIQFAHEAKMLDVKRTGSRDVFHIKQYPVQCWSHLRLTVLHIQAIENQQSRSQLRRRLRKKMTSCGVAARTMEEAEGSLSKGVKTAKEQRKKRSAQLRSCAER
jgi:hypothetical protein